MKSPADTRIVALDGLRGVLACMVLMHHVAQRLGSELLSMPAGIAVLLFFVMSGSVLSRAYDGRYLLFLARRVLRLWPVYGACLLFGYAVAHVSPEFRAFIWYPPMPPGILEANLPAWSLWVEAWAALFMPVIAWFAGGSLVRAAAILPLALLAMRYSWLIFPITFLFGGVLARWTLRCGLLERPMPQWLGKLSYSLYLSHWPVLLASWELVGIAGVICGVPVALGLAWLIWKYIERPSIALSRKVVRPHSKSLSSRAVGAARA